MTPDQPRTPSLPKLSDASPLGAWLANHLLKVTAVLVLVLVFLLVLVLRHYGFEVGSEGLHRSSGSAMARFDLSGILVTLCR